MWRLPSNKQIARSLHMCPLYFCNIHSDIITVWNTMFCAGSTEVPVPIFHRNAVVCAWALRSLPAGTFSLGWRRWWRHRESWVRHSKTSEFSSTNTRNAYSLNATGREIHVSFVSWQAVANSCVFPYQISCRQLERWVLPEDTDYIVVKLLIDAPVKSFRSWLCFCLFKESSI